jgi:YjjI family glycine radical enzyme
MVDDLGERYGVVSCYNSLPVGGGSHTLVRVNLKEVALRHHGSAATFAATTLPRYLELAAELMEARIRHLVDDAGFFEHSWLVHEGLLSLDRFTAMLGLFGLAECVEVLLAHEGVPARFGHDDAADELAAEIVAAAAGVVATREQPHCEATGGRALLHSQAGLDSDVGVTAGTRVAPGREPPLYRHLRSVAPLHRWFRSGVSDIVVLDPSIADNPRAGVDVARGAFALGMRDVTYDVAGNGFTRVTGYLVRTAELPRIDTGVRHASTVLGAGAIRNTHLDDRRVQRVRSHELDPRPGR